jgi:hypothetical protein
VGAHDLGLRIEVAVTLQVLGVDAGPVGCFDVAEQAFGCRASK